MKANVQARLDRRSQIALERLVHRLVGALPARWVSDLYSVRIGRGYRALGAMEGSTVVRFRIGSQAKCDRLLG